MQTGKKYYFDIDKELGIPPWKNNKWKKKALPKEGFSGNSTDGKINIIRFHKNSFLIAELENGTSIKGNIISPQKGIEYKFKGKWVNDSKWGYAFCFTEYTMSYPKDIEAIESYLKENCKWIGEEISGKITTLFGEDSLNQCKNNPQLISKKIPGITLDRALQVSRMLKLNEETENMQLEMKKLFKGIRISRRAVNNMLKLYKHEAVDRIKKNPYQLIIDIKGIGFLLADQVALKLGYDRKGEPRIHAGIMHTLKEASNMGGHTCLPENDLIEKAVGILNIKSEIISSRLDEMVKENKLVKINNFIYLRKMYEDEIFIAKKLKELMAGNSCLKCEPCFVDLKDDQINALKKAVKSRVFVLTGVPGSGKSHLLKQLIESYSESNIVLTAPTGIASRRMFEFTRKEAKTIHKLLEPRFVNLPNGESKFEFARNSFNPIDADIITVDESSMIGIDLMRSFLDAVKPNTKLIMIGDSHQLPSISPGNVLRDMIDSGIIPTAELTTIKRQNAGLIIQNCHKIKNGQNIEVNNSESKDFFFLKRNDANDIQKDIIQLITKRLPETYKADPLKEIQILSPLREKTILSCRALNELCQKKLNLNPKIDKICFKKGDKVIQKKNNYDLDIVNGDIGIIQSINIKERTIYVKFDNLKEVTEIPLYDNDLQLAYSLTVHSVQGNEFNYVIIPIHKSFGTLITQRNLLYTAISRAKKMCILVGQLSEIPKIISRNQQQKRFTNLEKFLQ